MQNTISLENGINKDLQFEDNNIVRELYGQQNENLKEIVEFGMNYINPLDVENIRDSLKFVVEQIITDEIGEIDYQDSEASWPVNDVLDAHINLFRNLE